LRLNVIAMAVRGRNVWVTAILLASVTLSAATARANPGYELDPVQPSIPLSATLPLDIDIDQASQNIYVAEASTDLSGFAPGRIEQLDASGNPTAASPFVTGGSDFFAGVAVNPVTHGIYAYQGELQLPSGNEGTPKMSTFTSAGALGSSFNPGASVPSLAADPSGRVYFPDLLTNTVKIFSSAGAPEGTVTCTGCPGGAFDEPKGAALDSTGNLYVVDIGGERVTKFKPSGGSYIYDSVLQSGAGAVAVGVDPGSDDVFVGELGANGYHVVAFDASGTQFDDFGAGVFGSPEAGPRGAGQIAVNATTRKVYVTDPSESGNVIRVFQRLASIPAPSASTSSPSPLGQVGATLKGIVNPKGHGLLDCHFEYTDDADFDANGFDHAVSAPCLFKPGGTANASVTAAVSGLTPQMSYDYRLVVTSNGGTAEGDPVMFTTLPPFPPDVTTGSASAITQTKATVGGTVNARGGPISNCHFEYTNEGEFQKSGFDDATSVPCSSTPSGTSNASVSAKLTGLVAGTAYRFRLVATNNSGTSTGQDRAFSASAETCATNPTVCPPPEVPPVSPAPSPLPPLASPPPTQPAKKPLKCRRGFKKKRVRGKPRCVRIKTHAKRNRL
jgi:hypothetical protein